MREACNIKSWRPRAVGGVGKGEEFVVGEGIYINLQQIVELRNGELSVHVGAAITRISLSGGGVAGRKQAAQESRSSKAGSRTGEDGGARDAEFQSGTGLKGNLLAVDERLVAERNAWLPKSLALDMSTLLPGAATHKELPPDGAEESAKNRQFYRRYPVIAEHGDRLRVVAEQQRSSFGRAPPQRLLSKAELIVVKRIGDITFKHSSASKAGYRPLGSKRGKVGGGDGGTRGARRPCR